ncbi:hypothetical protein NEFER01_1227 [Nematocida sp. LUAm1]|nr:hypothetical protein NEFER02_0670 [Nematocida sp. LUAm2]KAI5178045.1 hypothetical protein NEFER01_1227 [Nematocida sp. LUAm1]
MNRIRQRAFLIISFVFVLFCLLLSPMASSTELAKGREDLNVLKTYQYFMSISNVLIWKPKKVEEQNRIFKAYTDENQTIVEADVLYILFLNNEHILMFTNECVITYDSSWIDVFNILKEAKKEYKVIWIYFVENDSKCIYYIPSILDSFKTICENNKKRNIVIEFIASEQYLLLQNPMYPLAAYIMRFKKLNTVWRHVLCEHSKCSSIILYNGVQKPLFCADPDTYFFLALTILMNSYKEFSKAFLTEGISNKHVQDKDLHMQKHILSIIRTMEGSLFSTFDYIQHFLNESLKTALQSRSHKYIKISEVQEPLSMLIPLGNLNLVAKDIIIDVNPISFIFPSEEEKLSLKGILTRIGIAMLKNHKMLHIYSNISQKSNIDKKLFIRNYSPIYVDFSFCVLNSLHRDCFQHFFSRTEYLLIRDIDCKHLYSFLKEEKMSKIFSCIAEAPQKTQILYQASTDPLKVDTTDSNLKNFCPKITDPNTVYYITKHMIFMKSTLKIKTRTEYQKYMVFDVLISKKEIQPDTLIIEERIRTITEKQTREKGLINELKRSKRNRTALIYKLLNTSKTAADHVIVVDRLSALTNDLVSIIKTSKKNSWSTETNATIPSTS